MTVRASLPGLEAVEGSYLNRLSGPSLASDLAQQTYAPDTSKPSLNVWGNKLFLVKIQIGLDVMPPSNMLLYDRKRSFKVFMVPQDDTARFSAFFLEMTGPRGGHEGLKMYRWARRTGDWEFSICLDRAPSADTKW